MDGSVVFLAVVIAAIGAVIAWGIRRKGRR